MRRMKGGKVKKKKKERKKKAEINNERKNVIIWNYSLLCWQIKNIFKDSTFWRIEENGQIDKSKN